MMHDHGSMLTNFAFPDFRCLLFGSCRSPSCWDNGREINGSGRISTCRSSQQHFKRLCFFRVPRTCLTSLPPKQLVVSLLPTYRDTCLKEHRSKVGKLQIPSFWVDNILSLFRHFPGYFYIPTIHCTYHHLHDWWGRSALVWHENTAAVAHGVPKAM